MRYAVIDRHGYVTTLGDFDNAPQGGVPVPPDVDVPLLRCKVLYRNGQFEATGIPNAPPALGMRWAPEIGKWVDARSVEQAWSDVRKDRDARLAGTDWTQLPDVPLSTKEAWAAYRQALRDITEQPGFPHDVQWPQEPAQ